MEVVDAVFVGFEHAIEAAENHKKEDNIAIFMVFEESPEDIIGNIPDKIG